jgi:gliding motility-associated-like protein
MKSRIIILLLLTLFKVTPTFSQVDTSFWFACPWVTPDHWWRDPIKMHIGTFAAPTTTVRIRQPAAIAPNKYDTTIVIGPNQNFDYTFWRDANCTTTNRAFDSLEVRPADQVVPYGLYISSSSNITIVYDVITRSPNFYNPETFSMKGQNGLGIEFVCPFQTKWHNQNLGDLAGTPPGVNQPKQQINIVGTQPNTTVWIRPKTGIVGHPANITYSIMLVNPGDAYTVENLVQNTTVAGNNLSGTTVVSDKPIAVTVADDSVDGVTGCYDLMGDQIVPVDIVGTDYIMNKGNMNAAEPDGAFIVGTDNFTQLTINDGVTTTTLINKGDTYWYHSTQPITYINATKPVYMLHATGVGGGCELGEAILPPLNCAGSNLVSFSRNTPQSFFLNLLCTNGAQNSFTLNNAAQSVNIPISAANFTMAPGTATLPGGPYWGAQLNLNSTALFPLGSYTVANTSTVFAMGVLDGGASTGGLYYYASSFLRRTTVTAASPGTICAGPNVSVNLTGTVSGGAITGVWTTPNGTGSFGAYTSTLNTVSTTYNLSNLDTSLSTIKFYLMSVGNCTPKKDSVLLYINQRPQVTAAITPSALCKNNYGNGFTLTGNVTNVIANPGTGLWTGGNGGSFGAPGVNTSYTPSPADVAAGSVTLTLTSQGPKTGCVNTSKSFTLGFMDYPVVTLPTTTIACTNSSSMALTGTVTGSATGYLWSGGNGGIFTPSSNSLNVTYLFSPSDLAASSITLTLAASNPSCGGQSDQIVVNITPAPTLALSGPTFVCATSSLSPFPVSGVVNGGGATAITWSTTNGTGAFSTSSPTLNNNYLMSAGDAALSGSLIIYGNTSGGFCPTVADTLRIPIVPNLTLTTNPSTAVCEFTPIQLLGAISNSVSGSWATTGSGTFVPSAISLTTSYFPSAGDLLNGAVVFSLVPTPTVCYTPPKTFTATFVRSPAADFSFSSKRCKGDPVTFVNTSSANSTTITGGTWDFGNGNGSSNPGTVIATYTSAGIYQITFTVTGTNSLNISCSDTVSKKISVNPLPNPDFSSNNSCVGLISTFQNLSLPANGQFNWSFGNNATPAVSTASAPNVIFNQNGPVSVILRETIAATQCTANIIKTVNVNPKPDAEFGMTNNPTVAQEPVYFSDFSTPPGAIKTWIWSFGDETSTTGQAPTHNYQNGGSFLVTLTVLDSLGCSDTTIKRIEVNLIPQVPSGFTPNGDGNNDRLFVKGGPFNKMIFRVYNNWGEKIYEGTDQAEGWDGRKDGKDQPVGVYVWTLEVDLYNNRTVKKNGDVTLMR